MNRQYIGARYVPKIFDNNGSNEWISGIAYEALTIVTYLNNSYTSKKPVPSTAGAPNVATDYWANTGNYVGVVSELTQKVDNLENEVENLSASELIFVGDSYGLDSAVGGSSWATLLATKYPTATFLVRGGTGFASDAFMETNWLGMLTEHVNTLTTAEKNSIKQVIVIGGANDGNAVFDSTTNTTVVNSRIDSFCSYVASNLPNAMIKCCFVGWNREGGRHPSYLAVRDVYANYYAKNYCYVSNGENIMRCNDFIRTNDGIHPTATASTYLATFVNTVVTNGDYKLSRSLEATISTVAENPVTYGSIDHIFVDYEGDVCSITVMGNHTDCFHVLFPEGTTLQGNSTFIVGELSGTPVGGPAYTQMTIVPCNVYNDGGTPVGKINVAFFIQFNMLYGKLLELSTVQWRDALIPWFTIHMNMRHT